MDTKMIAREVLENLGGKENIINVENCMTRLRIQVNSNELVRIDELKKVSGVLGVIGDNETYIQVVLGPGIVRKVMEDLRDFGIKEVRSEKLEDWKINKDKIRVNQKKNKLRSSLQILSNIFVPMIPAFIASGVSNGLSRVIKILITNGTLPKVSIILLIQNFLALIGTGFLAYLVIFTGINAAKEFRVNPMLGGMIGAAALDKTVNSIAELLGWYSEKNPQDAILSTGAGGVIGVIVGVWLLSKIEKNIRKFMPDVLDISFTPILSMIIVIPIYVLLIMPITGVLSVYLGKVIGFFVDSSNPFILFFTGYVLAATFLPLVLFGLHRGLTPIYTIQIKTIGSTKLFPTVAMAGAGQVGAAIALYIKAKRLNNKKMQSVIGGGLPAAFLGIGEPLIYGLTLPLGKPFITAGLGAGFGGAYVMYKGVASTAFSPSGILAATHVLPELIVHYLVGLFISYIAAGIITYIFIPDSIIEGY